MGRKLFQRKLLLFLLLALTALICSLNLHLGWGAVYGQTAGPTPTPDGNNSTSSSAALAATLSTDANNPAPGSSFNYILKIQNSGSATINEVIAIDVLPSLLSAGKISTEQGTTTSSGQEITVQIGTLNPSQVVNVNINVQVRKDSPAATDLTNAATVQGKQGNLIISNSSNAVALKVGVSSQAQNNQFLGGWGPDLLIIVVVVAGFIIFRVYQRKRSSR